MYALIPSGMKFSKVDLISLTIDDKNVVLIN